MAVLFKCFILVVATLPFLNLLIYQIQLTNLSTINTKIYSPKLYDNNSLKSKLNKNSSYPFEDTDYEIANYYISNDFKENKNLFESCDSANKRNNLLEIIAKEDLQEVHLNLSAFKVKFGIEKPYCTIQRFDKLLNSNEHDRLLEYYEKYAFTASLDYKIILNKHGFYYVECFYYVLLIKKHTYYEDILNILPLDMTALRRNQILNEKSSRIKPNILIFVFDSLSKNHFKRVFPSTHNYLTNQLKGNKIFENLHSVGEK